MPTRVTYPTLLYQPSVPRCSALDGERKHVRLSIKRRPNRESDGEQSVRPGWLWARQSYRTMRLDCIHHHAALCGNDLSAVSQSSRHLSDARHQWSPVAG